LKKLTKLHWKDNNIFKLEDFNLSGKIEIVRLYFITHFYENMYPNKKLVLKKKI